MCVPAAFIVIGSCPYHWGSSLASVTASLDFDSSTFAVEQLVHHQSSLIVKIVIATTAAI